MRIPLYKMEIGPFRGHYTLLTIIHPNSLKSNTIRFRVDTGCDITTINFNDAQNMKIDFTNLGQPLDAIGVGGTIPIYRIYNCGLAFDLGECMLTERMESINIARPIITEKNEESIKSIPSLLGMDFLQRYILSITPNFAFLEK